MLTLLAEQPECLWEDALPIEVKELPADLAALDVLLSDQEFLWPLVERWRWEFAQTMLAIHLLNHEESPQEASENRESHLHEHLRWEPGFARAVVRRAQGTGLISRINGDRLALTERGRAVARETMAA